MTSRSKRETPRQRWERQMGNLRRVRDNVETEHVGQGEKWCRAMRRYYDQRIEDLQAAEPPKED